MSYISFIVKDVKTDIIIFLAKYLIFIIAVIGAVYWLKVNKNKKVTLAASVILGVALALVLAKIFSKIYYHPRPFVVKHIRPLVSHGNDNGFPSEHTTAATAMAAVAYLYHRKLGTGLLVMAILVGLSRIWANVHSPLDILGGFVCGLAGAALGYYIVDKFLSKYSTKHSG